MTGGAGMNSMLSLLAHVQLFNVILAVGWADDAVWYTASNDNGATWTEPVEVGEAEEEQPSIAWLHTGEILVARTYNGGAMTALSADFGNTWTDIGAV